MNTPSHSRDHSPHVTDEKFNTASHLIATIFAIAGSAYLIISVSSPLKPWHLAGFIVYGIALIGLFLSSTLHHGIDKTEKVNDWLRTVDYCFIYLMIAGSVTPLVLVLFRTPLGWSIFGVSWFVAIVGLTVRAVYHDFPKWISLTLYISLGWLVVVLAPGITQILPISALILLAAGGLLYTVGGVIFAIEQPNPIPGKFGFHEIWHLFVVAGALSHYIFMLWYVLPAD